MTVIGLLGDTHGNTLWTLMAIQRFHEHGINTILQVGDYGIYNSDAGHLFSKRTNLLLKRHDMKMHVIPGNHEDWDFIDEMKVHEDGWKHRGSNTFIAPKGLRWEWEGVSFLGLGGAPSVDRTWRNQDYPGVKMWWEQEALTDADVAAAVADGPADVMVCHDAPYGVSSIEARITTNPFGFPPEDLSYALEGRHRMLNAVNGVKPKVFLHGHYHFPVHETYNGDDYETLIVGLNKDGDNYSLGMMDLSTLEVTPWNRGRYDY